MKKKQKYCKCKKKAMQRLGGLEPRCPGHHCSAAPLFLQVIVPSGLIESSSIIPVTLSSSPQVVLHLFNKSLSPQLLFHLTR